MSRHVCFVLLCMKSEVEQISGNFQHQFGGYKSCTMGPLLFFHSWGNKIISCHCIFFFHFITEYSCCKRDAPQWIKKPRTPAWIFITSILAQTFNELTSHRSKLLAFLHCSTDGIPAALQKPWLRSRTFLCQGVSVSLRISHSRNPEARRGDAPLSEVPGPFSVS